MILLEVLSTLLLGLLPESSFIDPYALLFVTILPLGVPAKVPDIPRRVEYWILPLSGGLDELIVDKVEE